MRLFFTRKELKLRRKRTIAGIVCLALVAGIYWILTRPHKVEPEVPTVIVEPAEPAERDNVEIFGEYVGRIRAQQFVEVRARVEGYLESMLFASISRTSNSIKLPSPFSKTSLYALLYDVCIL